MYIYQEKNTMLHRIHPFSLLLYIFVVSIFSLIFSHPAYLLLLLFSLLLFVWAADIIKEWYAYFKLSLFFIFIIVIVNAIVVQSGATILFWGPYLPGIGKVRITLEAIMFAITMGIRFSIIITAFCILTYVLHPDRGLKMIGSIGNQSVLALTISVRLFPLLLSDYRRIYDVQRCRGVRFEGSMKSKIKNFFPIMNAMLLSSLERSFQLAEALQARGYGVGKRSKYQVDFFRSRDYLILMSIILAIFFGIILVIKGYSEYVFYPRLQPIYRQDFIIAGIYSLLFAFPALLDWGWGRFHLLKSKI